MSTISLQIPTFLEDFMTDMVNDGYAVSKADVVRKALILLREEKAINSVLRAEKEGREGKLLEGDLDELAKKYSQKHTV